MKEKRTILAGLEAYRKGSHVAKAKAQRKPQNPEVRTESSWDSSQQCCCEVAVFRAFFLFLFCAVCLFS